MQWLYSEGSGDGKLNGTEVQFVATKIQFCFDEIVVCDIKEALRI